MNKDDRIAELEEKVCKLEEELQSTKEHLKRYTSRGGGGGYKKEYYEKNKEQHINRVKEYQERTNYKASPEKKKEYNRQAYLKRKEKLQKEKPEEENI